MNDKVIRWITLAGLLVGITMLLVFTRVGMIPVPTPAGHATIAHIPAIVGGILGGPVAGAIVGFSFGIASFLSASNPWFKDFLVAVPPRVLIGLVSAFVYIPLQRLGKTGFRWLSLLLMVLLLILAYQVREESVWLAVVIGVVAISGCGALLWWLGREDTKIIALAISGIVGSLTNTVFVMGVVTLRGYATPAFAWTIAVVHGIPEAIVSAIVVVAVVSAVRQVGRSRQRSRLLREEEG